MSDNNNPLDLGTYNIYVEDFNKDVTPQSTGEMKVVFYSESSSNKSVDEYIEEFATLIKGNTDFTLFIDALFIDALVTTKSMIIISNMVLLAKSSNVNLTIKLANNLFTQITDNTQAYLFIKDLQEIYPSLIIKQ